MIADEQVVTFAVIRSVQQSVALRNPHYLRRKCAAAGL
jgi:hypothetical protein